MEWISVKDRLPEDRKKVIVYIAKGVGAELAYLENNNVWVDSSFYMALNQKNVTHWKPIVPPAGSAND